MHSMRLTDARGLLDVAVAPDRRTVQMSPRLSGWAMRARGARSTARRAVARRPIGASSVRERKRRSPICARPAMGLRHDQIGKRW